MNLPEYSQNQDWNYSKLAAAYSQKAKELESKLSSEKIFSAVISKLNSAVRTGNVRFALESVTPPRTEMRVVLQFHVGKVLFNRFFNSQNGYRGQFWSGWEKGIEYNRKLIVEIRECIESNFPQISKAPILFRDSTDKDMGISGWIHVPLSQISESLNPELAKIWKADFLIPNELSRPSLEWFQDSYNEPKILLPRPISPWSCFIRDQRSAWLDIKGAFSGLYQLKDPIERAKSLAITGGA